MTTSKTYYLGIALSLLYSLTQNNCDVMDFINFRAFTSLTFGAPRQQPVQKIVREAERARRLQPPIAILGSDLEEATAGTDDAHSARDMEEEDKDLLKETFVKAADTCTPSLKKAVPHRWVPHFVVKWNTKMHEARALAQKGGDGGVALLAKLLTEKPRGS